MIYKTEPELMVNGCIYSVNFMNTYFLLRGLGLEEISRATDKDFDHKSRCKGPRYKIKKKYKKKSWTMVHEKPSSLPAPTKYYDQPCYGVIRQTSSSGLPTFLSTVWKLVSLYQTSWPGRRSK